MAAEHTEIFNTWRPEQPSPAVVSGVTLPRGRSSILQLLHLFGAEPEAWLLINDDGDGDDGGGGGGDEDDSGGGVPATAPFC